MTCPARILQEDDRWGGIVADCELPEDHFGPHMRSYDAYEPVAWLSWMGSYEGPIPAWP